MVHICMRMLQISAHEYTYTQRIIVSLAEDIHWTKDRPDRPRSVFYLSQPVDLIA
jgi:hypothetical protein